MSHQIFTNMLLIQPVDHYTPIKGSFKPVLQPAMSKSDHEKNCATTLSKEEDHALVWWITISLQDVNKALHCMNVRKSLEPDGISGHVLCYCAFTSILKESLAPPVVPMCLKKSTIIPIPKNSNPSDLNDYRSIALPSLVMKVFVWIFKDLICSSLPSSLDLLQFTYQHNRSTNDAISHFLHNTLMHLNVKKGNYAMLLFTDYSSAFNTIVLHGLSYKFSNLELYSWPCEWKLSFLTGRLQVVKVGECTSNTIVLNTEAPQGWVLSLLLYLLYTHDCVATHLLNFIVKFADNMVALGLITSNDETAYLEEVENLSSWCQANCLT